MAFLPQNEQNQNAPQGQTTNNPLQVPPQAAGGSVGAGTSGGGGSKAGTTTGTPTQFGSSSSKLGDYLSANAPQITNQANQIAGSLTNQYNAVNQGIANAANQFGQQVSGGYTAPNQTLVDQALSNPTQFAQNASNVDAFKKQLNDAYMGPQNYEGTDTYGQIQGQVNSAVQNAGLLNTPAGLQSYLASTQKNPTRASTTLDQLLLSGNPDAQQTVKAAAQQFQTLPGAFNQSVQSANAQVQSAQDAALAAQQYAQTAANKATADFQKGIQDKLAAAEKSRTAYNTGLQNELEKATPLNKALQTYMAQSGISIPNLVQNIIAQNPVINPATAETVSSAQDFTTQEALNQLIGNIGVLQGDVSQAGTFSVPTLQTGNYGDIAKQEALAATAPQYQKDYSAPGSALPGSYFDIYGGTLPQRAGNELNADLIPFYESQGLGQNQPYQNLLSYLTQFNPDYIKGPGLNGPKYLNSTDGKSVLDYYKV